ncbi:helix-turn-helix transcriptional regulator [Klenkia soli]|uniref:helix-turn-helix transcriptional regulator n=1 Tax=Klenkia soli TaxID=1052260 RepID=UPI001F62268A|nr:helix-turn-helix domain-containing protein [Klenkia soli]
MTDKLLTIHEAAERLRVPISTLRYWRQARKPSPPSVKIGRRTLFPAAQLDAWIDQQREAA